MSEISENLSKSLQKIKLYLSNGSIMVWDASDAFTLRNQHRIVGQLTGSCPGFSHQVTENGLPLCLLKEEAKLLLELQLAELLDVDYEITQEQSVSYKEHINRVAKECQQITRAKKEEEIRARIKDIIAKRQTRTKDGEVDHSKSDEEHLIQEKLNLVDEVNKDLFPVQLFTKSPWNHGSVIVNDGWNYPSNRKELIRYHTFKDLWKKSYYITSGFKFGCDFLVYESDPLVVHARYMILCKDSDENFSALHLISSSRLSVQVNKQLIIASIIKDNDYATSSEVKDLIPVYLAFHWRGNQDSPFKRTLIKL